MSSDQEKIDFKILFDDNNFETWAKQSFADEEFGNNLNKYIQFNYGESLNGDEL